MKGIIRKEKYRKGHRYFVDGDERVDSKLPLVSCSAIAGYAKSGGADGLMYWAADHALATGRRDAFKESNERAMTIGQAIHNEIAEHIGTGKEPEHPSPIFGAWYSSMQEQGVKWLAAEGMTYHARLKYAGTFDAIGIVDDEVTIFDWKTTDGFDSKGRRKTLGSADHATQVAGYILAISSHPHDPELPTPTKAVICYLLKDIREVVWHYVDIKASTRAFLAGCRLHMLNKAGLYETR